MPADILVVTPSTSLGETIRQTMEQTDIYRVHIVNNKISAVVSANKIGVPLVMLDLALGEEVVDETVIALRTYCTSINIVILCDDGASVPLFDSLRPWILVRKPFRMTDFISAISQPQTPVPTPVSQNVDTATPWLNDATKAAQHLTRITLGSSAQAALITRKNDLWAYAVDFHRMPQKKSRRPSPATGMDKKALIFCDLSASKAQKPSTCCNATRLTTNTVLALVFEAETPFSTIRGQAS